jgi:3-hydroxyacyl-[acyl-carrier-protein] dehydratase
MLLLDICTALTPGQSAEAVWRVPEDLAVLAGHFPGAPVLPGVYTAEAMAQTADLLLLSLPEYRGKAPLLIGIDKLRFTRKILPGEEIALSARMLLHRPEKAIATVSATASVAGEPAASGEITLALR